ncbi:AsmA family protein [Moraxellaceae bacterium AER2_44_116]|nr:AsmA family protein [Moraxellaceae bacterium]TQC95613.1 AsmA family protein [Moraxellaceae bacterium AER2_44_116]
MSKVSKIIALGLGGILVLILGVMAFILFVIDPNDYKQEIYTVVKDKTDMDLVISDRIEWQLWPQIGLKLGKTTLSDTAAKQTLVAIKQANVTVQVMPLLAQKIAIDSVLLDGATLNFIQYANGTSSWDKMLNKLKSQPEDKSEKIEFNIKLLNINNSALAFKDEKTHTEGQLDRLLVQATDIDLKKAFPIHVKFAYNQKDGQGKTLIADNDLNASVQLEQEVERYTLKGLTARSHLEGTLLPAPMIIDVQGDVVADMKAQVHTVDGLKLIVDYQDPALKSPAHVDMAGKIVADMKQQLVDITGLQLAASYPEKSLKSPATVKVLGDVHANLGTQQVQMPSLTVDASYPAANLKSPATLKLNAAITADLKQQIVSLANIKADAAYPDPTRPAPITATINGAITANLTSGAVNFAPLDLQASLSDKAFPKVMPIHLTAPISANWKEGKIALNGFNLDALSIKTKGQLQAYLPALAATAKPNTPVTQGMTVSGHISTSPFNLRQLMQDLGMAIPVMKDTNTLKTVSVNSQLSGNDQSMLLKGMKVQLDESTLTGDAGISDLKTQKLYARLAVDKINVDRYLPPTDPNAKPSAGGLLPIELLKKQNVDVVLTIGSLTAMNYPIKQLQVVTIANGGVVQVSKLGGSIYNGTFNLPTTIDVRGKEPIVTVQPNIQQIDMAAVIQQFTKKDLFAGKTVFQGKLQLTGNTVQAWTNSVTGNSTLKFDNGVFKGVNMMQLALTELSNNKALAPFLSAQDAKTIANKQNDTEISSFLGEADIKNGLVNTKSLNADLKKGKIEGGGSFNLVNMEADYSFKLHLDKSVAGEGMTNYPIPIRCKGNISAAAKLCTVDSRAVREMATSALLNSEKAQKLKAELETKKTEAQAKAQLKLDEAVQKANVKLSDDSKKAVEKLNSQMGDKVNEQLQKLFKH